MQNILTYTNLKHAFVGIHLIFLKLEGVLINKSIAPDFVTVKVSQDA